MSDNIITGERLQELCDMYCGLPEDFQYNFRILRQVDKHIDIACLESSWDNPSILFCYTRRLSLFMEKRHFLNNPYKLITHNSDENIKDKYRSLLDDPKLICMYSQNICIDHPKLFLLPIGIANSIWIHGNLDTLSLLMTFHEPKSRAVYFYFTMEINRNERELCFKELSKKGLVFGSYMYHIDYLIHLSNYKFAICPDGRGIDTHRIWECYYLGVIPILYSSIFTRKLREILPCILLDNWSDFNMAACLEQYDTLYKELLSKRNHLELSYYKNIINT